MKKHKPVDLPEHEHFIKSEIAEIDRAKWLESEKVKRDLGKNEQGKPSDTFTLNWISQNGESYRELWDNSCCKTCQCFGCTEEPKKDCTNHTDSLRIHIIKNQSKLIDFEIINIKSHEILGRYYLIPSRAKDGRTEPEVLRYGSRRKKPGMITRVVDAILWK